MRFSFSRGKFRPRFIRQTIFVLALLACAILSPPPQASAADLVSKQDKLAASIKSQSKAQEELDQWNRDKQALVQDVRDAESRLAWTEYQADKYARYVAREKRNIAILKDKLQAIKQIRYELEPYLDEVYARLEKAVADDLPFLHDERALRLKALRDVLDDHTADLGEKLRRTLEAVQIEASYGSLVEARETLLHLHGEAQPANEVEVLQLGRLALFYRTPDGSGIGRFNKQTGQWEELPEQYGQAIKNAIAVARNKRVAELLDLPIGALGGQN